VLRIWNEEHGELDAVARWDAVWGGYFAEPAEPGR
jgi:hypothetical protein